MSKNKTPIVIEKKFSNDKYLRDLNKISLKVFGKLNKDLNYKERDEVDRIFNSNKH